MMKTRMMAKAGMGAAGTRLRALPAALLAAALVAASSLTPVPGCDQLHTQEFFAWADTARVTSCLRQGADVTARDPDGNTALHWAARYAPGAGAVTALLDAGADPDARQKAGATPLHWAARYSASAEVITALAEVGASLDARQRIGGTPLHTAARYSDHPAVIAALVDAGAPTWMPATTTA